jgi:hypothetical protein
MEVKQSCIIDCCSRQTRRHHAKTRKDQSTRAATITNDDKHRSEKTAVNTKTDRTPGLNKKDFILTSVCSRRLNIQIKTLKNNLKRNINSPPAWDPWSTIPQGPKSAGGGANQRRGIIGEDDETLDCFWGNYRLPMALLHSLFRIVILRKSKVQLWARPSSTIYAHVWQAEGFFTAGISEILRKPVIPVTSELNSPVYL